MKNRYNAIKNFLLIKKEERLFKTIIKYIEILRKYDVDSNQYRFETLIYNQNCVNENDLIQNGIVLNKLPNYLDLFISFDEEYQNKILEIIKKQEKYHLDQKELERIKIEKEEREEEVKKKKFSEIQEAQKINNDRKRKEKVGFVISIIAFILYIVLLIIFNIIQFDDLTGFGIVGSIINFIVQFVYLSFYSTSENDGHSVISVLNVITILFVIISLGVACDNCF